MPLYENRKNTVIASKVIELSEHPSYIELVDRVCYYDAQNANGVQLNYDEDSLAKAETLINQPVVAKYLVDKEGKPTLGGHGVVRTASGIKFSTSAIGVHTDVKIEDAEVELVNGETKTMKCLFSTMKIWTRFENMVAAVRRLFDEGRLHNSWEISVSSYKYENGIKHLIDYEFVGNALLGEAIPAYGSASRVLSLSSIDEDCELMIAEALSADLIGDSASNTQLTEEGGTTEMEVKEVVVEELDNSEVKEDTVETVETVEETAETKDCQEENETKNVDSEEVAEVSEGDSEEEVSEADEPVESEVDETSGILTTEDIYNLLRKAIEKEYADSNDYYYVSMVFPEDHTILARSWKMLSMQFVKFTYRIEGDEAILSDKEDVQFVISPLQINSEIENKNNAIAEANNRIVELEAQVAELNKAKEELDAIRTEKANAEHAEAVEKLRVYVENSGRFTKEELEGEEIKNAIDNLNEAWLKSEIADRLVASLNKNKETRNIEVSEHKSDVSILLSEGEKNATSEDIMRAFFSRD